ncbi:hypothetical protein ACK3ZA_17070 [Aeromonas caviae]|uniref:hypothetical protein n=1 Tax=Aeromonas caviae TaxID=648 RepID=UPI00385D7BA3
MALIISQEIRSKLHLRHGIDEREVEEAFANLDGAYLVDPREEHATNPPTEWFVAPTNRGRLIKVIFVNENGNIYLKSAYEPSEDVLRIYKKYGRSGQDF